MGDADQLDRALRTTTDPALLVPLHVQAADQMASDAARRFHLTHAWVYALVAGDQRRIEELEHQLKTLGGL